MAIEVSSTRDIKPIVFIDEVTKVTVEIQEIEVVNVLFDLPEQITVTVRDTTI